MEWEAGRRLKSITQNGTVTSYKYNLDGMRTAKIVNGLEVVKYYYDGENKLIGINTDGMTFNFYYDTDGEITAMSTKGGAMYLFVKNLQGDITAITTDNGTVLVKYTYDEWGNTISITNAEGTDATDSAWARYIPFRYRGYVFDSDTGLYYLQSRYYDPQTGRFLNEDIYCDTGTGSPLSTNMFTYCENNPVMAIDPMGEDAWWIQDKEAVEGLGHTSLIVEDNKGYLWYYYWGDSSKQFICIGKDKDQNNKKLLKRINNFLHKNDYYDKDYSYSGIIKFKGNFVNSFYYIYSTLFAGSMLKGYPTVKIIIVKNPNYNALYYNCMQTSIDALLKSSCLTEEQKDYLKYARGLIVPRLAYRYLKRRF